LPPESLALPTGFLGVNGFGKFANGYKVWDYDGHD